MRTIIVTLMLALVTTAGLQGSSASLEAPSPYESDPCMDAEPASGFCIAVLPAGVDPDAWVVALDVPGLAMEVLPYAVLPATEATAEALSRLPDGMRPLAVHADGPVIPFMDTAIDATRVRPLHDGANFTFTESPGQSGGNANASAPGQSKRTTSETLSFTGEGVGIAIIDGGFNCGHPDLASRCVPGRHMMCEGSLEWGLGSPEWRFCAPVPQSGTGLGSGDPRHGTWVAGVAVGDGSASGGRITGTAPAASLYPYGFGAGQTLYAALGAMDHILAHPQEPGFPEIRVVSMSWGVNEELIKLLAPAFHALADADIVPIVAAGNDRTAIWSGTNELCFLDDGGVDLEPMTLCAGGSNDGMIGSIDGGMYYASSRGDPNDPRTWPDLVAPGVSIAGPRAEAPPFPPSTLPDGSTSDQEAYESRWYTTASGTSASAPHVAGAAALLLQADPSLSAVEVIDLLQNTTYASPAYGVLPNHHAGTGGLDVRAAVEQALGAKTSTIDAWLHKNILGPNQKLTMFGSGLEAPLVNPSWTATESSDVNAEFVERTVPLPLEGTVSGDAMVWAMPAHPGGTLWLSSRNLHPAVPPGDVDGLLHVTMTWMANDTRQEIAMPYTGSFHKSAPFQHEAGVDGDIMVEMLVDYDGDGVLDPETDARWEGLFKDQIQPA